MKRSIVLPILALVCVSLVSAQQGPDIVSLYRDNFRNGNRPVKLELLRSSRDVPGDQLAPFYEDATRYIATNVAQVAADSSLQEMLRLTVAGVESTTATGALEPLWYVFEGTRDTPRRIELLDLFAAIGAGDDDLERRLNGWLSTQNELFRTGSFSTDLRLIDRVVRALGVLSVPSSFSPLLDAAIVGYSTSIATEARRSMFAIEDDSTDLAIAAFRDRTVEDKPPVFNFFFRGNDLTEEQKDRFVTAALEDVLSARVVSEAALPAVYLMRYQANIWLRDREYGPATAALIGHFNRTYADYDRGLAAQPYLIEALDGLGAMGTEEAARRLSDFLDLINRYTEFGTQFNADVTLATIRNIEKLGFALAYNSLFYTTLLNYPPRVKDQARRAMTAVTR